MNKFVVKFKDSSDSDGIDFWFSQQSFIFNNPLDAVDYFKKNSVKNVKIISDGNQLVLIDCNNKEFCPDCFWAKMPND